MVKRLVIMTTVLLIIGGSTVYWIKETNGATLKETVNVQKHVDDFILHIRVESINEGFQILRSLEYRGDERIKLDHRTPLIGVSIDKSRQEFTGSPVEKTLDPGDIYHPQEPQVFPSLDPGNYTIYMHCQFFTNGERVDIKTDENIVFQ